MSIKIKVTLIKNNTAELQYIDAAGREEHCSDEEKTDRISVTEGYMQRR